MSTPKQKPIKISSNTKVSSISPWSLALNAFFYSIAIGIVWNVIIIAAWQMLNRAGAFSKLDSILVSMAGDEAAKVSDYLGFERVMGVSIVLSVSLIAAVPLFALISGVIFNAISRFTGGVSITMTSKIFKNLGEEVAQQEKDSASLPVTTIPGKRARRFESDETEKTNLPTDGSSFPLPPRNDPASTSKQASQRTL